jgi:hypothetical protein
MDQIHKRFTVEQVAMLLKGYYQGTISRIAVQETLSIRKTRFFALLKEYNGNPKEFSLSYKRASSPKLSSLVEAEIKKELLREKKLVEDKRLPISDYNYSALKDRLRKSGIDVSLTTIIGRAKSLDCYKPRRKGKIHDREVVTASIGALIQHDASLHLWSPYAQEKWTLITSIDDFSRKLLFADFFPKETTWAHIQAAQVLMQTYGIPLRYYVDSLRVFRFIQNRDSFWRKRILETDEVDPQWRQVMRTLGVDVSYALSPQAKGKIERPYRWLQDRIVRTCALEKLSTIEEARTVLREELNRYNNHQVHSTTGEIPSFRFETARKEGNSLFSPYVMPKPFTSPKDVFCLREKRMTNGYRRITLFNHEIEVPGVPIREEVELHLIPDIKRNALEIRIWWENSMVHSLAYPLKEYPRVHF